MFNLLSGRPDNLGVRDGRLAACPDTPNCVCSQSESEPHSVEPIPFEGSAEKAKELIREALLSQPRTQIVTENPDYIHAEVQSAFFRFVDDVEIYLDGSTHLIHLRSASRIGRSDLGVNRERVEAIRAEFARRATAAQKPSSTAN